MFDYVHFIDFRIIIIIIILISHALQDAAEPTEFLRVSVMSLGFVKAPAVFIS